MSLQNREYSERTITHVVSEQGSFPDAERVTSKFLMKPQSQVISPEKSIDLLRTDVMDDRRLEDKQTTYAIDLISKLPQPILHQILGNLLAEDAARVAVLSKTWYQVWDTLPFLDFDEYRNGKDLFPYVDSILSHRKNQGLGLHKLRFGSKCYENFGSYLVPWIRILRDLQVRDLCFRYHKSKEYGRLPEIISSIKSITSLELCGFHVDSFRGVDMIKWPSLRKLHLSKMLLNDDVIHNIVTNCNAIEGLTFEYCSGLNVITISSLVKLQNFVVTCYKECPKVEINIPSLRSFRYMNAKVQDCFRINACTGLKTLVLTGDSISQEWFDKLFSLFPLLEYLTISSCKRVVKVNVSSCNLKFFKLSHDLSLVEANIDTPNLSTFVYSGDGDLSLSLNAMPHLQVRIYLKTNNYSKAPGMCGKVLTLLRMFGHFEVVKLSCHIQSLFFPEETKDELTYFQCDLKDLILELTLPFTGSEYELTIRDAKRLLDNLLWIYSRLENLSILAYEEEIAALEVLYEMLSCGEDGLNCCDSIPIKCWRHFLKDVNWEKIESKKKILKIKFRARE